MKGAGRRRAIIRRLQIRCFFVRNQKYYKSGLTLQTAAIVKI
ncbi:MAG: hypothetical protein JWP78_233 [Mucilaginibacter sp.]|nr:hypothetical protein [Mucilaginibacter sp.]